MTQPRWLGPRRYAMLRHLGWSQSIMLYGAVAASFTTLGFFIDLGDLAWLTPWPTVFALIAMTGLSSACFLAAAIRGRQWFLGGFGLLALLIVVRTWLPKGADPALHSPSIAAMVNHAQIDGFGCMLGAIVGYSLFVRFIARQGTQLVRLDTEIGLASEIHTALAPPIRRTIGRFELCGVSLPSSEVGGDLLDAFTRDGALIACVADVAGHGVPAGTLMAMVRSAVRVRLDTPATLDALCADVHRHLVELDRPDRFVTLAAIRFGRDGIAEWTNAGHPPMLLLRRDATTIEHLESGSVPLGVPGAQGFVSSRLPWRAGDTFVLFTDGLTEIADGAGREFGIDGIERILLAQRAASPDACLEAILRETRAHGRVLDDRTVLIVRIHDEGGEHDA